MASANFRYSAFVQNSISRLFGFAPCSPTWAAGLTFQIVVPHRMIEHGTQLVMERFQIHRGIGLAILVLIAQHFILPRYDLF